MSSDETVPSCPSCGARMVAGARFCEGCGAMIGDSAPPSASTPGTEPSADHPLAAAPISAPTRRPSQALPDPPAAPAARACVECGGEVGSDFYCTACGSKAPSPRDHFEEQPAVWVAGVCDRGIVHSRNEDAMALLASTEPGARAVLVVLDGVSNSIDSDVASLAGAKAAREVLRMPLPSGMGTPDSRASAVAKVFSDAAKAANSAIVATTDPDSPNPASATFVAAVLEGSRVHVANVGDSRAYWLPDAGEGVQLTVDDSLAQELIAGGMARDEAEQSPQAHAITKWLGRDSPDISPRVAALDLTGSGWLLVCSDGLWNYASTPAELGPLVREGADDVLGLARALVAFANGCGGRDNITASLARVEVPGQAPAARVGQNAAHPEPNQ